MNSGCNASPGSPCLTRYQKNTNATKHARTNRKHSVTNISVLSFCDERESATRRFPFFIFFSSNYPPHQTQLSRARTNGRQSDRFSARSPFHIDFTNKHVWLLGSVRNAAIRTAAFVRVSADSIRKRAFRTTRRRARARRFNDSDREDRFQRARACFR